MICNKGHLITHSPFCPFCYWLLAVFQTPQACLFISGPCHLLFPVVITAAPKIPTTPSLLLLGFHSNVTSSEILSPTHYTWQPKSPPTLLLSILFSPAFFISIAPITTWCITYLFVCAHLNLHSNINYFVPCYIPVPRISLAHSWCSVST